MMTNRQRAIVLKILSSGYACGLMHPFEAFVNYDMHFISMLPFQDQQMNLSEATQAFIEFWKTTASDPETQMELDKLDHESMTKMINDFYANKKCYACHRSTDISI